MRVILPIIGLVLLIVCTIHLFRFSGPRHSDLLPPGSKTFLTDKELEEGFRLRRQNPPQTRPDDK